MLVTQVKAALPDLVLLVGGLQLLQSGYWAAGSTVHVHGSRENPMPDGRVGWRNNSLPASGPIPGVISHSWTGYCVPAPMQHNQLDFPVTAVRYAHSPRNYNGYKPVAGHRQPRLPLVALHVLRRAWHTVGPRRNELEMAGRSRLYAVLGTVNGTVPEKVIDVRGPVATSGCR